MKTREAGIDKEIDVKVAKLLTEKEEAHKAELKALQEQLTEVEKVNLSLESQVKEQKATLNTTKSENDKLNRQADMQATMFERSREVLSLIHI